MDKQIEPAEYEDIGRGFIALIGTMVFLGHRSGSELGRYCERPADPSRALVLDAFLTANLGPVGAEARQRVEQFVLDRGVDHILADAIATERTL
jgi:hypothetical protein